MRVVKPFSGVLCCVAVFNHAGNGLAVGGR